MRYHTSEGALNLGIDNIRYWHASKLENNQEDDISKRKGRVKRNEMGI